MQPETESPALAKIRSGVDHAGNTSAEETAMRPLEFGWYLPTNGDTTQIGNPEKSVVTISEFFL